MIALRVIPRARTVNLSFARARLARPARTLSVQNQVRFARTMAYNNTLDVTQEIKLDHDNVRDLFERFKSATDKDQRAMIANTLIREMAIHGDAE